MLEEKVIHCIGGGRCHPYETVKVPGEQMELGQ